MKLKTLWAIIQGLIVFAFFSALVEYAIGSSFYEIWVMQVRTVETWGFFATCVYITLNYKSILKAVLRALVRVVDKFKKSTTRC